MHRRRLLRRCKASGASVAFAFTDHDASAHRHRIHSLHASLRRQHGRNACGRLVPSFLPTRSPPASVTLKKSNARSRSAFKAIRRLRSRGALAGFNRKIQVGHVEAGLRSGNLHRPVSRRIQPPSDFTNGNLSFCRDREKPPQSACRRRFDAKTFTSRETRSVDALNYILKNFSPSDEIESLIAKTSRLKRILLTTHRRESFGAKMRNNLKVLAEFVEKHQDVCLIFPVHLNPNVRRATRDILANRKRVFLLDPLDYIDFVSLMKESWLIVSDSGGVQEEAPSLGKPLLILRENTERPEAVRSMVAKLVGGNPEILRRMLEENYSLPTWIKSVKQVENPFGDGKAAKRIVRILEKEFPAKIVKKVVSSKIEI
ncbi:UDP-N-acetylglucosamine 2-epimerase (non-hydrolyzing) [Biomphalaria pfeifferi]|uniref:UDP-N-acetylglucosamine 2-epimerase (non-hydrolyzing) n=1 Tax=Biomphalaria pfeifferi TaxID=112525 RepID=A0AAD8AMR3_BIOPF|nr:UDP-N-acetylglucosamine 2-epimerase (non-hydrolyzing) [Biomphalaria pfeifferi]